MNLIDKLGGYAEAKNILNHPDAQEAEYFILEYGYVSDLGCCGPSDSSFVNATLHKNGDIEPVTFNYYFNSVESIVNFESTVDLLELGDELLEYRRKNEIYELGDLVVYEVGYKFVMEVGRDRKKGKLLVRRKKEGTNFALYCSPTAAIRHATDEEIKKGCRV